VEVGPAAAYSAAVASGDAALGDAVSGVAERRTET
jgi:hypothetical protein